MLKKIDFEQVTMNPSLAFGRDWAALTAGNEAEGCNAMTISWGQMGSLWGRGAHGGGLPVVTCYVRPSRYTYHFMEREARFTVSFLPRERKKALAYLGSHSGRDEDKFRAAALTPAYLEGTACIAEAELVLVCQKLYQAPLQEEGFLDREVLEFNYPERDFHMVYIGEVLACYGQA